MYCIVSERDEFNYYEITTQRNEAFSFNTWMSIVPLLRKNLIAFIRISRRELIHTEVKDFTAVLTVLFNELRVIGRKKFPSRNFFNSTSISKEKFKIRSNSFSFFFSLFSFRTVLTTSSCNVVMNLKPFFPF